MESHIYIGKSDVIQRVGHDGNGIGEVTAAAAALCPSLRIKHCYDAAADSAADSAALADVVTVMLWLM